MENEEMMTNEETMDNMDYESDSENTGVNKTVTTLIGAAAIVGGITIGKGIVKGVKWGVGKVKNSKIGAKFKKDKPSEETESEAPAEKSDKKKK